MSFNHGRLARVLLNSTDLSPYFSKADAARAAQTNETTTFQNTSRTYIAGLLEATVTADGIFDGAAAAVDSVLQPILGSATDNVFTFAPNDLTIGNRAMIGQNIEADYKVNAPVADVVKINATFKADAGLDSGVSLHALVAETTTGVTASVDNGALTTNGGIAVIHATAASGTTPSLAVIVQHSADNAAWATLATFTTLTAVGQQRIVVPAGTTVNRYLRLSFTIAGTTPSFTWAAAFARR